ncbi:uncharacterized protein [Physcomitrium patens]|uniref:uncharacterized protein isoform X3 n=1 Tax=Physcomitrium patens TaxID=3218 RepID=UPI003CCD03CD
MVVSVATSKVDATMGEDMQLDSLDIGIESSIKRCEALLSMLPTTLGTSFDRDGLKPEWNKNMGTLSNISMYREISSSPGNSWKSYSLSNETSTQRSSDVDYEGNELQPVFVNRVSSTRSRTSQDEATHQQRRFIKSRFEAGKTDGSSFPKEWAEEGTSARGSSVCEVVCKLFDTPQDVSKRASSESGESARSAVTYSSTKNSNSEKLSWPLAASKLEKLYRPNEKIFEVAETASSSIPRKVPDEQNSLEEDSFEEEFGCPNSHKPEEISISMSNLTQEAPQRLEDRATAAPDPITRSDSIVIFGPQSEQPKKHSSCSSSTISSEPSMIELRKFPPQATKNAAELKPTGRPTNYRKIDTPSTQELNPNCMFDSEQRGKQKGKLSRHGRLKTSHAVASVARLSIPKNLAAGQRTCRDIKSAPEMKRCDIFLKPETMLRLATPKIAASQKVCHVHRNESSLEPRRGKKPDQGSKISAHLIERLGDIQERINLIKRAKKMREKEERDLCSFRPNINTKYLDLEAYQPIENRLDCIRVEKDKLLQKARDQEVKDLGITFRPQLNPNSVRIVKERGKSSLTLDINEELGNNSPRTSCNVWSDGPDHRAKATDESRSGSKCTFAPEINANTHALLAGTAFEGYDFLTRQQQFLDRIEQRKRMKQQELPPDFTFQPMRGTADLVLSCSPLFKTNENLPEMCERLSNADNQRRLLTQQKITENYYSQFAFHPKIDEISRLLGRNPSIETLYTDQKTKNHKCLLRRLAHEEFQRTCTFRPMVQRVAIAPTEGAVVEERKRIKQERKKQEDKERIMKEVEELAECTFKPQINPWPSKEAESGVQIKGVQRHLELQRLAKQIKFDRAEWEKKIFFSQVSQQNNERLKQQYTIPKPFHFHTGSCHTHCNSHCQGSPLNQCRRLPISTPIDPHLCT